MGLPTNKHINNVTSRINRGFEAMRDTPLLHGLDPRHLYGGIKGVASDIQGIGEANRQTDTNNRNAELSEIMRRNLRRDNQMGQSSANSVRPDMVDMPKSEAKGNESKWEGFKRGADIGARTMSYAAILAPMVQGKVDTYKSNNLRKEKDAQWLKDAQESADKNFERLKNRPRTKQPPRVPKGGDNVQVYVDDAYGNPAMNDAKVISIDGNKATVKFSTRADHTDPFTYDDYSLFQEGDNIKEISVENIWGFADEVAPAKKSALPKLPSNTGTQITIKDGKIHMKPEYSPLREQTEVYTPEQAMKYAKNLREAIPTRGTELDVYYSESHPEIFYQDDIQMLKDITDGLDKLKESTRAADPLKELIDVVKQLMANRGN